MNDTNYKKQLLHYGTTLAVLVSFLLTLGVQSAAAQTSGCSAQNTGNQPGALAITADLLVVRPVMLGTTMAGSTLFSLALPFTAPTNTTPVTANAFVKTPARATFERCLGCFDAHWFRAAPPAGCSLQQAGGWSRHIEAQYPATDELAVWEWSTSTEKWNYLGDQGVPPQLRSDEGAYEANAVLFSIKAAPQLNQRGGNPHTLVVKIIQMTDPAALANYRASSFRLADLLAADATSLSADFLREDRLIIAPGETYTFAVDRLKPTRYLAIITGHYQMQDSNSVRLLSVPAVNQRDAASDSGRWWWPFGKKQTPIVNEPARMKVWIEVGEERILNLGARAF
jgi:type VI secretion system VasD/TssJ family lipoprotein